jgi:hypothetical protein
LLYYQSLQNTKRWIKKALDRILTRVTGQGTLVLAAVELPAARLPAGPGLVVASALSGGRLTAEAVGQKHLLKQNKISYCL